jgi:hypothetical protein
VERFDADRIAAKSLRGCRSVLLGPKLLGPAGTADFRIIKALLPPEVATGLRIELAPGWRLHDVAPGHAGFVTFTEYGHGGIIPPDGADLTIHRTTMSVDEWLKPDPPESIEHITIDGRDAVRVTKEFDEDQGNRIDILIPDAPSHLGISFNWYPRDATAALHLSNIERMIRSARFFPGTCGSP